MSICILKHIEKKYRNGEEIEPLIVAAKWTAENSLL